MRSVAVTGESGAPRGPRLDSREGRWGTQLGRGAVPRGIGAEGQKLVRQLGTPEARAEGSHSVVLRQVLPEELVWAWR